MVTTWFVLLNIVILIILLIGLFYMQKKHISFSKRVFTALGLGIIFGFGLQFAYGSASEIVAESSGWIHLVGGGYVKFKELVFKNMVDYLMDAVKFVHFHRPLVYCLEKLNQIILSLLFWSEYLSFGPRHHPAYAVQT